MEDNILIAKKIKLKTGDTLLYKSSGFLGKSIRYFMKRYAKKKYNKKKIDYPITNHMGTIIEFENKLYVSEAVSEGYVIKPIHIYHRLGKSVFVYRAKKEFTEEEKIKIRDYAFNLSFNQTGYEFLNFIWWIIYITTNFKLFIGGKKDKHVFCFEAAARCLNASGRNFFEKPYFLTSVDIQEDDRFERII